jgi:metallo-beta-lactamase family protein
MPILRDPTVAHEVDVLVTESTYGDREHPAHRDVKNRLEEICRRTLRQKGRLVIPAFSVGRTQQIVYFLNQLSNEGKLDDLPIYVDSPLSTRATTVYERHTECYDAATGRALREGDEPFWFPNLTYTSSVEESKQLNGMSGPVVIISASGMCEGGRILHHLKHSVEDERNTVLIVGYQAEHTLGRRLADGVERARIFGRYHEVRARVETIDALSAHADRHGLAAYFSAMGPQVGRAFVVHGDEEASLAVVEELRRLGAENALLPEQGKTYTV